jgi:hypothetical protein
MRLGSEDYLYRFHSIILKHVDPLFEFLLLKVRNKTQNKKLKLKKKKI